MQTDALYTTTSTGISTTTTTDEPLTTTASLISTTTSTKTKTESLPTTGSWYEPKMPPTKVVKRIPQTINNSASTVTTSTGISTTTTTDEPLTTTASLISTTTSTVIPATSSDHMPPTTPDHVSIIRSDLDQVTTAGDVSGPLSNDMRTKLHAPATLSSKVTTTSLDMASLVMMDGPTTAATQKRPSSFIETTSSVSMDTVEVYPTTIPIVRTSALPSTTIPESTTTSATTSSTTLLSTKMPGSSPVEKQQSTEALEYKEEVIYLDDTHNEQTTQSRRVVSTSLTKPSSDILEKKKPLTTTPALFVWWWTVQTEDDNSLQTTTQDTLSKMESTSIKENTTPNNQDVSMPLRRWLTPTTNIQNTTIYDTSKSTTSSLTTTNFQPQWIANTVSSTTNEALTNKAIYGPIPGLTKIPTRFQWWWTASTHPTTTGSSSPTLDTTDSTMTDLETTRPWTTEYDETGTTPPSTHIPTESTTPDSLPATTDNAILTFADRAIERTTLISPETPTRFQWWWTSNTNPTPAMTQTTTTDLQTQRTRLVWWWTASTSTQVPTVTETNSPLTTHNDGYASTTTDPKSAPTKAFKESSVTSAMPLLTTQSKAEGCDSDQSTVCELMTESKCNLLLFKKLCCITCNKFV